ncbi:MAG: hypothetical protein ACXV8K_10425 [Ilumatobacteraceae bacterium]
MTPSADELDSLRRSGGATAARHLNGLLRKRRIRAIYVVVVFGIAAYLNKPNGPWLPFLALGVLLLAALLPMIVIRPDDAP